MPFSNWMSAADHTLTKKLRDYSVKHVKIAEAYQARSRRLARDYIEDQIIVYCRQNSPLPILRMEYTGSVYERLKTEASDEVDIMVVLKTHKAWLWGDPEVLAEEVGKAGYVRLRAREDSIFRRYATSEGYIDPERLRNGWFYGLVARAVNVFNEKFANSDVRLSVRHHGPAIQVDITEKQPCHLLLSVDLVPCFETGTDQYFVPKSSSSMSVMSVSHPGLLWRQSFSLNEKYMLLCMDRDDHGCRHELLRIVKTIVKRERTSLGALESYHVKSAFVHYIAKNRHDWAGRDSHGKHFLGFLGELQCFVEKRNLPVYWNPRVNLLEDINPGVLEKMANRLKRILNSLSSEVEIDNFLFPAMRASGYTSHLSMPQNTDDDKSNALVSLFVSLLKALEFILFLLLLVTLFCCNY